MERAGAMGIIPEKAEGMKWWDETRRFLAFLRGRGWHRRYAYIVQGQEAHPIGMMPPAGPKKPANDNGPPKE